MRELEARDAREREARLPPAQRMRALVPEAGQFIAIVIRAMRAQKILEIGTSYGYSTLWLASAAQAHGGHVDTIEIDADRFAAAKENFQRAGLSDAITQHHGDAKQIVKPLGDDYDFIFIDAEKDDYEDYLDLALNKLVHGGIIMADNVLSHADQLQHYSEKAQHTPGLLSVTVPVGRGEELSLRVGETGLPSDVVATLAQLEVYAKTHKDAWAVPRAAGKFLHILARAVKAKAVIELGTSTGYSGLWLASALKATGGRALTLESDPAKIKIASESFTKAKIAPHISIVSGRALDVISTLDNQFDFAFIDASKDDYLAYADALWPKLSVGALIVADNIDSHKETLGAYAKRMQSRADALSVTLHIGNGMELTMKE